MRRYAILVTLFVLVLVGIFVWRHRSGDQPAAGGGGPAAGGPPGGMQLPVEAITVQPEALGHGVATVGTLRADEAVVVRPEIAGRIVKIHFTEGQRVEAGATLFSLDASVARASLREAQATLDNARRSYDRSVELSKGSLISRSELDNAQAQLSVSEARVASAKAQLEKMTLVAPFAGVVGLREVSVGAYVTIGQTLVNLVRLDPMEVDFSLPENELAAVTAGQPVTITVDALAGQTFTGQLKAIEPTIDINSRSVKLRAQIANAEYKLRPGLFARVNLGTDGGDSQALMVPEQALLQQGETRFVYRIVDGKASRTEVQTGKRVPGKLEIVKGLKAGDQVITAGQGKPMMHDGMPVMVLPSQGAPGAGAPGGPAGAAPGQGGAGAPPASDAPGAAGTAPAEPPAAAKPAAASDQPASDTRKD